MCDGVSLLRSEIPQRLIRQFKLESRVVVRGEQAPEEIRFLRREGRPWLPAWHAGQLGIHAWGCRSRQEQGFPPGAWCHREHLEAGYWRHLQPEPVEIPANYVLDRGIWYVVRDGLRGVLLRRPRDVPRVYVLTEAASHYYHVMTRHDRMPVLLHERI